MDQRTPLDLTFDAVAAARAASLSSAQRAATQDHDDGFPTEDVADLARLGLLAAPVPRKMGGAGLGEEPGSWMLSEVLRLVGYGCLALGRLYEGHVNALQLITRYGDAGQHARLFADARAGHLFGVWNTEPAVDGLVLEHGEEALLLSGVKTFASGAGFVTRALVTARAPSGNGTLMLVVPLEAGTRADLSAWRAHGMRASATGTLDFGGMTLSTEAVLGEVDDYFRQPVFSGGAWRFASVQLGGIEAVFDAWRAHLVRVGRGADPPGKSIHAILDNVATHKHPKVRTWLARHPRWTFHFTPTSASWLNAVEGFFSALTRRRLRRGSFNGVVDLQAAIKRYIAEHNRRARPFVWTKPATDILAAVSRSPEPFV